MCALRASTTIQVVPHDAQIQSKGKTITRKGDEENPAVKVVNSGI